MPSEVDTLPHDPDAERAVLSSVLVNNELIKRARRIVCPEDFYSPRHRRMWKRVLTLVDAGAAVNLVTLKQELDRRGDLVRCGGPA